MEPMNLKLKGIIRNRNVPILIGFESTHNFVDANFTKKLNLFVYPTKDLKITIANGQVKGVGRCDNVFVQIQNLEL
jgi:hypothetical protein